MHFIIKKQQKLTVPDIISKGQIYFQNTSIILSNKTGALTVIRARARTSPGNVVRQGNKLLLARIQA